VSSPGTIGEGPWFDSPRAAYIHIPFCKHRCGYCDFATLAGQDHQADRYLAALELEIARVLVEPRPVAAIFVGGGTPTRLSAAQLARLTGFIARMLPLAEGGEWTVEANPGTLDAEKAEILAAAGVNRISLGAQSYQPGLLRVLEREHGGEDVDQALELVRPRFPRWSIDLIFGTPGSTLEQWADDLERALRSQPSHLSCYGLVYEKGTPLDRARREGLVQPTDEGTERAMQEWAIGRLRAQGLELYEISNYARPGEECRHNLVYWANQPYYGFGLGAASYRHGVRAINTRELAAYLRRVEGGESPVAARESLEPLARARETAMLMMRRTRLGVARADFQRRTGFAFDELYGEVVPRLVARGLVEDDGERVRLSHEGVFLADLVLRELV
jgi:oxygen-independent coproporphyrinogen-3 oxidase